MVPEVYHSRLPAGTVLGYDDAGKNLGNDLKRDTPASDFDEGSAALVKALTAHPACNGRIGVVGICLGGHLAFRAALRPEVLATACFYPTDLTEGILCGGQTDTLARAAEIRGELMMVFGRQDPHVPEPARRKIYAALDGAGTWFTWHEFNAAHAFLRDEGSRYDPAAAALCMELASDLFSRVL
jgi:carboxymethylenebutenolidase